MNFGYIWGYAEKPYNGALKYVLKHETYKVTRYHQLSRC